MSWSPESAAARLAATICDEKLEVWNFGVSVAFEGLLGASEVLDDPTWDAFAWGYLRSWAASRGAPRELDCTFPGLAAVALVERHDDRQLLRALLELSDFLQDRPLISGIFRTWRRSPLIQPYGPAQLSREAASLQADPPPGSFLDCLHFEPPLFAALGRLLDDRELQRLAVAQAAAYVDTLQQPDGLFDHFVLAGVPGTFGPGWGRGQGWALLGLLDVIEHLPQDLAGRADLVTAAQRLIGGLVACQRPDGHWDAQLGVADSGDEYSTAGFMAAGFVRAARLGVIERAAVEPAADAALAATLAGLDENGILTNVSAAVMACTEPSHYAHVPRGFDVPWGQGPALLAMVEHLRGWE